MRLEDIKAGKTYGCWFLDRFRPFQVNGKGLDRVLGYFLDLPETMERFEYALAPARLEEPLPRRLTIEVRPVKAGEKFLTKASGSHFDTEEAFCDSDYDLLVLVEDTDPRWSSTRLRHSTRPLRHRVTNLSSQLKGTKE